MRFFTVGLLVLFLSACAQKSSEYTGKLRIDAGTEYVALEYPSSIGGACEGWNALQIREPGNSGGMENIVCWKREGDNITVTDGAGVKRTTGSAALWAD